MHMRLPFRGTRKLWRKEHLICPLTPRSHFTPPTSAAAICPGEFSYVVHAATEASAKLNTQAPLVMFDTIVEGTRRMLEFSAGHSVRRFLFVSSGAVYGKQPPNLTHIDESFEGGPNTVDRASAYAEGKRAAEMLCALAAGPNIEVAIARGFAFVGPYMPIDAHFAIGNFISDALRGGPIQVKGDGRAVRSYLYASDLAVWLWTMLFKGRSGCAYNVGSEDALNVAALAHEVAAALPGESGVKIASSPMAALRYSATCPVRRGREKNWACSPKCPCVKRSAGPIAGFHKVRLPRALLADHRL